MYRPTTDYALMHETNNSRSDQNQILHCCAKNPSIAEPDCAIWH